MTRPRYLTGQQAVATPPQAKAFYAHPAWCDLAPALSLATVIDPTPEQDRRIAQAFTELRDHFQWRAERTDVWGNALRTARRLRSGKWLRLWIGDCDDFAVMLLSKLAKTGIPRGALRLCTCEVTLPGAAKPIGHLVLTVATRGGTLVLDQRQRRPLFADNLVFESYRWHAIEDPPAAIGGPARWVSLHSMTLADLAARAKEQG